MDVSSEGMEPSFRLVGVMGWRERDHGPRGVGVGDRKGNTPKGRESVGLFCFLKTLNFLSYIGV